jgi:hypothetical protein
MFIVLETKIYDRNSNMISSSPFESNRRYKKLFFYVYRSIQIMYDMSLCIINKKIAITGICWRDSLYLSKTSIQFDSETKKLSSNSIWISWDESSRIELFVYSILFRSLFTWKNIFKKVASENLVRNLGLLFLYKLQYVVSYSFFYKIKSSTVFWDELSVCDVLLENQKFRTSITL